VAVLGAYAFVTDFGGPLRVINVSDPTAPTQIGSYDTKGNPYGVAVMGRYVYVAATNGVAPRETGLHIVDVSNPRVPERDGFQKTTGDAGDIAVAGEYAYVADGTSGLYIINVSNPISPTKTVVYDKPGDAQGVAVARNYAYVADGASGLRIVDISNPITPTEEISHTTPGVAADVALAEGYVYVADESSGLVIFYFAPATTVSIPPDGGEVTSPYDDTTYEFPAGTFTDTVIITHTPRFASDVPSFGRLVHIDHIFELTAVYSSTGRPAQPAPGFTYTMTVHYRETELDIAREATLAFYYWDGDISRWVPEPTSSLDVISRTVTARPDHLSYWAVLAEPRRVFLPLVSRRG
jgi:hypothetical protein